MQLNSLFSFLGKSALQADVDTTSSAADVAKSSTFASMLAATFSHFAQNGRNDGAPGEHANALADEPANALADEPANALPDQPDITLADQPANALADEPDITLADEPDITLADEPDSAQQLDAATLSADQLALGAIPIADTDQHAADLPPDSEIDLPRGDHRASAESDGLISRESPHRVLPVVNEAANSAAEPAHAASSPDDSKLPPISANPGAAPGSSESLAPANQPDVAAASADPEKISPAAGTDITSELKSAESLESESNQQFPAALPAARREGTTLALDHRIEQEGDTTNGFAASSATESGARAKLEMPTGVLPETLPASPETDPLPMSRGSIDTPGRKSASPFEPNRRQTDPNRMSTDGAHRAQNEANRTPSESLLDAESDRSSTEIPPPKSSAASGTFSDNPSVSRTYVRAADLGRASHFHGRQFRVWNEASPEDPAAGSHPTPEATSAVRKGGIDLAQPAAPTQNIASSTVEHDGAPTLHPEQAPSENDVAEARSSDTRSTVASELAAESGHRPGEADAKSDRSTKTGEKGGAHGVDKTDTGSGSASSGAGDFADPQQDGNSTLTTGESLIESDSNEFNVANADLADAEAPNLDASGDEVSFAPERPATTSSITSTEAAQANPRARATASMAWIRSMLSESLRSVAVDGGWKVLEMPLENGQGSMTVRARRDEDKVSVSVSFTDPQLRAMAEANADRLQNALQEQYESNVDFSLMSDGAGESPQQRGESRGPRSGSPQATTDSIASTEMSRATRTALSGARNEWVG